MADIVERLRGLADVFEAQQATHNLVLHMRAGADEIERLRAGGCARDQGTTQYCAEAAKLAAENERLRAALREAYEVYAGSDGFIPETAGEGYQQQIIRQMVNCISAALEGK